MLAVRSDHYDAVHGKLRHNDALRVHPALPRNHDADPWQSLHDDNHDDLVRDTELHLALGRIDLATRVLYLPTIVPLQHRTDRCRNHDR
jgi:hypothetical protein